MKESRNGHKGTKHKKSKRTYCFRDGARVEGVEPADALRELGRIRDEGPLTPERVVEESRPEDAPLHPVFEWDNDKAAEEYRKQQARNLIRVVCEVPSDGSRPQPVFVHITTEDGGAYEFVEVVAKRPDLIDIALGELRGKLAGAQRSVNELLNAVQRAGQPMRQKQIEAVQKPLNEAVEAAEAIVT